MTSLVQVLNTLTAEQVAKHLPMISTTIGRVVALHYGVSGEGPPIVSIESLAQRLNQHPSTTRFLLDQGKQAIARVIVANATEEQHNTRSRDETRAVQAALVLASIDPSRVRTAVANTVKEHLAPWL